MFSAQNKTAAAAEAADDITGYTGYEIHLIADSLGDQGYSDGGTIDSGWTDETGDWNFDDYIGSPTYETNEVNGHDIAQFLGDSVENERLRDLTTLAWGTSYSLVYVIEDNSTSATNYVWRTSTGDFSMVTRSSGNQFEVHADDDTIFLSAIDTTSIRGQYNVIIVTVDMSASALTVYLNSDTATASDTDSAGSQQTASYINLPTSALWSDVNFAEMIVYNGHILTSSEIANINDVLGAKYNITIN